MANDQQIAVKKRLIYAEDLFEPVDFKVFLFGGRGGGKTMAMYEGLFRKRVEVAPTIDAVEVVRCKDCKHRFDGLCPMENVDVPWVGTKDDDFCSFGERRTDHA